MLDLCLGIIRFMVASRQPDAGYMLVAYVSRHFLRDSSCLRCSFQPKTVSLLLSGCARMRLGSRTANSRCTKHGKHSRIQLFGSSLWCRSPMRYRQEDSALSPTSSWLLSYASSVFEIVPLSLIYICARASPLSKPICLPLRRAPSSCCSCSALRTWRRSTTRSSFLLL